MTTEGEKWLNTTSNIVIKPINNDKHVSFETTISEDIKKTENTTNPSLTKLLNIIKKKSEPEQIISDVQDDENKYKNENMSIRTEIEYLIKKQDNLIAEHIELKKRLNIILNKI